MPRTSFTWEDLSPSAQARLRALNPTVAEIMPEAQAPEAPDQSEIDYLVALKVRDLTRKVIQQRQVASTKTPWWFRWLVAGLTLFAIANARGGFL